MKTLSPVRAKSVWSMTNDPDSTRDCTVAMRLSSFQVVGAQWVAPRAMSTSRISRRVWGSDCASLRLESVSIESSYGSNGFARNLGEQAQGGKVRGYNFVFLHRNGGSPHGSRRSDCAHYGRRKWHWTGRGIGLPRRWLSRGAGGPAQGVPGPDRVAGGGRRKERTGGAGRRDRPGIGTCPVYTGSRGIRSARRAFQQCRDQCPRRAD